MEFEHNESFDVVCIDGDLDIVKAVVERTQVGLEGARVDNDKNTPLLFAAERGRLPVVQYLCEQAADKEMSDGEGRTSLQLAKSNDHLPVVKYLLKPSGATGKRMRSRR